MWGIEFCFSKFHRNIFCMIKYFFFQKWKEKLWLNWLKNGLGHKWNCVINDLLEFFNNHFQVLRRINCKKIEVLLRPGNVVVFSKNAEVQRPPSYEKEIISNCYEGDNKLLESRYMFQWVGFVMILRIWKVSTVMPFFTSKRLRNVG